MCLITKSDLNIQYSHADYHFKNISYRELEMFGSEMTPWGEYYGTYYVSLITINFSDGLR
jgi:hypothetical protein